MLVSGLVYVIEISEPSLQLIGWHCENLVGELAELFCKRINGEEVGGFPAVNQFFSSSAFGASSFKIALATRATTFESALFSSVSR